MTTTIRLIGVGAIGLMLAMTTPAMAQGRGKGGGKSEETPLIIVFRDADGADGDLLRSDGLGPYIAGGEGIDRAAFDGAGEVRLSFIQPKGKNTSSDRHFSVDLSLSGRVEDWGGEPPFEDERLINAFFHISADDGSVRDLAFLQQAQARFPIFSERKSELEGWKLSFSDPRLGDEFFDDRVTVTCVMSDVFGNCIAWKVEKEIGKDPVAALVGGGTKEEPDAGVWELPFAIAVCLRDVQPFASDAGLCKAYVFPP